MLGDTSTMAQHVMELRDCEAPAADKLGGPERGADVDFTEKPI